MIRPVLVAVALLTAPGAFAAPQVGDQAIYTVRTVTRDGKSASSTNVSELVQFDSENHRYLQRDTHKVPGQPDQVQDTWKETAELFTDEKIEHILEDCDEAGGRPTLVWEPAGIFQACILPVNADDLQPLSGHVWIARVPFGIAHAEFDNKGVVTVLDLWSYQGPMSAAKK